MEHESESRATAGQPSGAGTGGGPQERGVTEADAQTDTGSPSAGVTQSPTAYRLVGPNEADRLEAEDRKRPIPGGEPNCPVCGRKMVRHVERHPAPHGGASPFRVRLTCADEACGAWTVYDW